MSKPITKSKTTLTIDTILLKKAKTAKINISNAAEIGIRRVLSEPYGFDLDEKPVTAEQIVGKQKVAINKLTILIQDLNEKLKGGSK